MSAVQARDDGAHPVLGEPGDAHLPRDALHLAGAGVDSVHLDHGGHEGEIDALVAFDHLLREEAAGAQLGDAQRQRADAGGKRPLAVAVAAVGTASAQLVGPASITAFSNCSASLRSRSRMSMTSSSNRGMASSPSKWIQHKTI